MEESIGRVNFAKSYNWNTQMYSNPDHKRNVSDLNLGAINKTNWKPDQQRPKYGLGYGKSRDIVDSQFRPSPYGLCPSIVRPNKALVWEYNGNTHTMGSVQDYNLTMNKLY